jgi:hypothetical protein
VSPELAALIAEHRARLDRLVRDHEAFFAGLQSEPPGLIEREAAGAMLHSFYMGIEFILRAIAEGFDGGVRKSDAWHTELLESMMRPGPRRQAVLSPETGQSLKPYLAFRHRFRNIYGNVLDWALMQPLVLQVARVFERFQGDLTRFLDSPGPRQ